MRQHPQAKEALLRLVAEREGLYARSDVTVDTTGLSVSDAVERVAARLAS
jgi:hypothetical protein